LTALNSISPRKEQVGANSDTVATAALVGRKERQRRITLAWSTSLLSKASTLAVQALAIPLVYRALGNGGYAAYAAVTASAGLIGILNLGIGGSLVTPIAEAAARQDERRQAALVHGGLAPLAMACVLGSLAIIPAFAVLPLTTLFGKVGDSGSVDLRVAALIAVSATLAAVPLSAITFLRQAYQELHLSNLLGAASNALLCVALLVAAARSTKLAVFVGVFVLVPLVGQALNFGWLLLQRPFLLRTGGRTLWEGSAQLTADGILFLGASFSSVLIYQWPVYWIARTLSAETSSWFAISMQAVVLPLSAAFGLMQPLWPSTADALARKDHHWLDGHIKKGRAAVIVGGVGGLLVMLVFGQVLMRLWLRKPFVLDWPVRGLMGAYFLLATWEYFHVLLALGFGQLRRASSAVIQRSICFAVAVPALTAFGGLRALWCGMCCSILFWSAWRLPRLLHVQEAAPER
jgi:O-antigen/teichoic acid export membrane protein